MKKLLSLILALALCLSIFATIAMAEETKMADKIVVAIGSDPQDLYPCNYNTGDRKYVFKLIYETLFWSPSTDVYEPLLAKSYEVVDDMTWRITLFDNIYDSAGNHITADDVIFSHNYLVGTGYAIRYDYLATKEDGSLNIEKEDDYTLLYHWAKDPSIQLGSLSFILSNSIIFSQKAFEEGNFATNPVGTGRYVVDEFVTGSKVVCSVNENYWQTDPQYRDSFIKTNVKTVELDVIPEAAQQVMALKTGTVDYVMAVAETNLADFQPGGVSSQGMQVISFPSGEWYYLTPNETEGKITANEDFRKAIYYAINNAGVAQGVGSADPMVTFGSPFTVDVDESLFQAETYINTYDLAKSKEYLEKSGYNGETLRLMADNSTNGKTAAQIIQAMLLNAGINVELRIVEANMLPNYCATPDEWELYFTFAMGANTQMSNMNRLTNPDEYGNGMAFGFIADDQLTYHWSQAGGSKTWSKETVKGIIEYIIEKAYYYPVFYATRHSVIGPKIAELVNFPGTVVPNISSFVFNVD
ncbi:MAG: ABC transporter substrate-binding protein [Clostridia bacterium]|nr:ABC transporter substrate-binding protein [Clostridia bacterium]